MTVKCVVRAETRLRVSAVLSFELGDEKLVKVMLYAVPRKALELVFAT